MVFWGKMTAGDVSFNSNGDRLAAYELLNIQPMAGFGDSGSCVFFRRLLGLCGVKTVVEGPYILHVYNSIYIYIYIDICICIYIYICIGYVYSVYTCFSLSS